MQWKYKVVDVEHHVRMPNHLEQDMNGLGEQEWELVTAVTLWGTSPPLLGGGVAGAVPSGALFERGQRLIFKRTKTC